KIYEAKTDKSSVDEPPVVELKVLPPRLEYAFLEGDDKLPVIVAKDLSVEEKTALITVLKSQKRAISWKLSDIKGCLAIDGNTFLEFWDNIQGYVLAAAVNYNQEKIKKMNEINIKSIQTQINNVKSKLRNEMKTLIQASMYNQTNELKNMMASFFQMNTTSTLGSGPLPNNTIANPKEEDERTKETLTDKDLAEYTIKVPPPLVQKAKTPSQRNYVEKLLELANTPLNENYSALILKKLPETLGDPGKFLISCGFSELKCKALADLGARINMMPLSVGIARDIFIPVGKFTFPADFIIVYYKSNPRVPLILGRPFLWTVCGVIDVYEEEMILHDEDERLTLNMRHVTSSNSNQPQKESINMINIYHDSYEDYLEDYTTSSSIDHVLEEFDDELTLITFPPGNDDLSFDIESNLREIDYLLNHDPTKEMDSILKDSIDEDNLVALPIYDDFDDDLVELESDNEYVYDDPFDSKEDKMKESKLLIDELDPLDQVISFLLSKNLSEVTVQVTPDKNVKKIAISHASLILEDFKPPLSDYELPFHKEVPWISWILKTRACGFVLRSLVLHILGSILGF
nr:hypothetical protein [Tanacetum cinerariifolium]